MGFFVTSERKRLLGVLLVLLAVASVYANHFQNTFHFDDWHTVVGNVYIQNVKNVPRFFADARLFSTLPTNQAYQPVTSATLAIDYWLAGGLKPFYFHLSTFVWFLAMLALLFFLFRRIMDVADDDPSNSYFAVLAMACYGLHPAIAETVNYIIQRADIYSTLGVVAGLVLYIQWPGLRKWGWYMVPAVIGMLAKAPVLIFPLILLVYVFLFEMAGSLSPRNWAEERKKWAAALKATLPAFVVGIATAAFIGKMTSAQFSPGGTSSVLYRMTQPFVALHYFKSFFLPTELSADTDWTLVSTIFSTECLIGFAFVAAMLVLAVHTSRNRQTRPIAFGIVWFFLALIPTSITPLAEVMNDHRMFFPFIGLSLSVVWTVRLVLFSKTARLTTRPTLVGISWIAAAGILLIAAAGTWQRNRVWHTEESLWLDVTLKSPKNGRGLMNYGLTQMSKGEYATALNYFERAQVYTSNYYLLEVNLGIVDSSLGRDGEAESHFQRALLLAPNNAQTHYFYARWLKSKERTAESIANLEAALQASPNEIDARDLLMQTYFEQGNSAELQRVAQDTLRFAPDEAAARNLLTAVETREQQIIAAEKNMRDTPTADGLIDLSLLYYQTGKYSDCIRTAKQALALKPSSAEAFNNIAASYNSMGLWDDGIQAAKEAVRLKPDFELARNNLLYAVTQKQHAAEAQTPALPSSPSNRLPERHQPVSHPVAMRRSENAGSKSSQ
jgi:protein O-mannosyl-transferase